MSTRKLTTPLLALLALAVAVGSTTTGCAVVIADECDERAARSAEIDAAGATRLVVDAGAGSLVVTGRADADRVTASGEACAATTELLEEVNIEVERSGDTLKVTALYPEERAWTGTWGAVALDLTIEAPSSLELVVDDGSGPAEISGFASVIVDDGSGELRVENVASSVTIDDGSGGLYVLGVDGDVLIDDGSGEIEVTGVGGQVRIKDGSGGILLRDVGGAILDDGSGGIDVERVEGRVTLPPD